MERAWPCPTCPVRDFGLCGALLGKQSDESRARERPLWQDFRTMRDNENIVVRGYTSEHVYVLCEGWAFRYYQMADGRRQILHILLAGDLLSAVTAFEDKFHFSVRTLTEVRVALFRRAAVREKFAVDPAVSAALTRTCVAQSNDVDELLTTVGRRSAEERLAYLFLYLARRALAHAAVREHRYPFPLRQQHIADMIGLTPVHVNRVIGQFRERGLIELSGGFLTILNPAEIERIGALR